MKFKHMLNLPVFPPAHRWGLEKCRKYYESKVTTLARKILEGESLREGQRFAWER